MMLFAEMEEPRVKPRREKREPKPEPVRRPMTDAERKVAMALCPTRVCYGMSYGLKRFGHEMATAAAMELGITEAQSNYLFQLRHRFRRQLSEKLPTSKGEPE